MLLHGDAPLSRVVTRQVTSSNGRIILFIDEIHTVVGAGATGEGGMDAGGTGS